ncbi:hypothetical protein EJB05_04586, partial [Eragrostis curvula]
MGRSLRGGGGEAGNGDGEGNFHLFFLDSKAAGSDATISGQLFLPTSRTELLEEGLSAGCCGVMAAKIRIVMKSFVSQSNRVAELMPNAKKIGLPESRALYTVLRSPHIDKKSREQFSMHVKKQFLEQKVEAHELRKKYFWLKRLRAPGAQCEIQISFKTRLDKKSLESKLLDVLLSWRLKKS